MIFGVQAQARLLERHDFIEIQATNIDGLEPLYATESFVRHRKVVHRREGVVAAALKHSFHLFKRRVHAVAFRSELRHDDIVTNRCAFTRRVFFVLCEMDLTTFRALLCARRRNRERD